MDSMKHPQRRLLAAACCVGLALGGVMLWLGLLHDPQSEFHLADGGVDYGYCLLVFASWTLSGALFTMVVLGLYLLLRRFITGR